MTEIDKDALEWPERLTLRDTKVFADEGQRILTTATGYGYEKREYVRADIAASPVPVVDWRRKRFIPIEMPLNHDGQGPASVEKGDARKITYEVWDAANCDTHGSFDHLLDAINEAERLNAALPLPLSKEAYVAVTVDEVGGATVCQTCNGTGNEGMNLLCRDCDEYSTPTPAPVEAEPVLHAILWPDAEAETGYVPFVSAGGTKSEPLYSQADFERRILSSLTEGK